MREFELLRHVYAANRLLPSEVVVPPGDDMAAIRLTDRNLLVAVDQVIEGRHVVIDEDPALVGRKAVARNLSDVAAMAARPVATVASVALPKRYGEARSLALFEGVRATADLFGCPLIGGDTAIHHDGSAPLVLSVTILAAPAWPGARVVTRRGGQVGDGVYVTGLLGGSLEPGGGGRHLHFSPRLNEAMALLELLGERLHSMIDVSDGVGRDAAHLTGERTEILLASASIPTNGGLPWQRGLGDGEDYELLFTATGAVPTKLAGVPITRIGTVMDRTSEIDVRVTEGDQTLDASAFGWEHAD